MTVLVLGGSGFLGTELVRQASTVGHTTVATYATRPGDASPTAWYPLDLRDAGSLDIVMAKVRPQFVINASSGLADWATTAEGPIRLAMVAARYGTLMVHVPSDAMFSGVISGSDLVLVV
ncbi:sugar nucleotide-binding protein [Streptomyces sp. NPDC001876]|uniref:sugar nucleotide-binding protein n=1 Tax=Streptomyces sp. NPDC001876 TaxID=3154402 RepID=UPI00331F1B9D